MKLPRGFVLSALGSLLCLSTSGRAIGDQALGDGPLDLKNLPAVTVDEVVVPVPSEVFEILHKLGEAGWKDEIRRRAGKNYRERGQSALVLGVAIADGFIAVQAEDAEGIEAAGRLVLQVSELLGLRASVVPHCQGIFDAAKSDDWAGIRAELDKTQETVRATMRRMRDDDLAELVSLGGWLRGTEAVTSLISNSYTSDKAELLNQPELARHFSKLLVRLRGKSPGDGRLALLAEGLGRIETVMTEGERGVTSVGVGEILESCAGLVETALSTGGPQSAEAGIDPRPQG